MFTYLLLSVSNVKVESEAREEHPELHLDELLACKIHRACFVHQYALDHIMRRKDTSRKWYEGRRFRVQLAVAPSFRKEAQQIPEVTWDVL